MIQTKRPMIAAEKLRPGAIVIPFPGDEPLHITEVRVTGWGSVKLADEARGLTVEMSVGNRVKIVGHFNA